MSDRAALIEDAEARAEAQALATAVAIAESDPRRIKHEAVRAWLLLLAEGDFEAAPPAAR